MKLLNIHKTSRSIFEIQKGYQPYSSIFYILSGSFKIYLNNNWITVKKGDIVYLPHTLYFEREIISPIEFYYLRFYDDEAYFRYGGILNLTDKVYFEKTLRYILDAQDQEQPDLKSIMLESIFCQSLIPHRNDSVDSGITQCMDYITEHYCEDITLDNLCDIAGYSKSVLSEKFKKIYNITPFNHIIRLRLEKAKEYLTNSLFSVSEIAELCGFHCPYYFSNTFKKHFAETPTQYRKNQKI